ncbi:MAG: hypothetical protein GF383_13135 [Candidatus Lokiarchaeota archaeon]|nr:hypothetical protein [Candidatus Lokiarchaeota archaeon]MBD3342073.1 hypothetical protein [Candidatus Lokiarchaeota archaeon]
MEKINIDELLKILPKLIRENDTIKGAIISALSGVVATHDDIVELIKTMEERFETMQRTMDERFEKMDRNFDEVKSILENIQQEIGKPFEQFGRNVVMKILESEGKKDVSIISEKFTDPKETVAKGTSEVEVDGFSLDPPIIVEITSILRGETKVEKFLRKKRFVEKKFDQEFRGFFVAASSKLSPKKIGEITITLRKQNCELINL